MAGLDLDLSISAYKPFRAEFESLCGQLQREIGYFGCKTPALRPSAHLLLLAASIDPSDDDDDARTVPPSPRLPRAPRILVSLASRRNAKQSRFR